MISDGAGVSPQHWIQFTEETQTVYGIPQSEDVGSTQYSLVAVDHKGNMARTPREVEVVPSPNDEPQGIIHYMLSLFQKRSSCNVLADEGNTNEEKQSSTSLHFLKTPSVT